MNVDKGNEIAFKQPLPGIEEESTRDKHLHIQGRRGKHSSGSERIAYTSRKCASIRGCWLVFKKTPWDAVVERVVRKLGSSPRKQPGALARLAPRCRHALRLRAARLTPLPAFFTGLRLQLRCLERRVTSTFRFKC